MVSNRQVPRRHPRRGLVDNVDAALTIGPLVLSQPRAWSSWTRSGPWTGRYVLGPGPLGDQSGRTASAGWSCATRLAGYMVVSVDADNEVVRVDARCTTAGALARTWNLVEPRLWFLPAGSRRCTVRRAAVGTARRVVRVIAGRRLCDGQSALEVDRGSYQRVRAYFRAQRLSPHQDAQKRQMFGRAGLTLQRKRALLAT